MGRASHWVSEPEHGEFILKGMAQGIAAKVSEKVMEDSQHREAGCEGYLCKGIQHRVLESKQLRRIST